MIQVNFKVGYVLNIELTVFLSYQMIMVAFLFVYNQHKFRLEKPKIRMIMEEREASSFHNVNSLNFSKTQKIQEMYLSWLPLTKSHTNFQDPQKNQEVFE